MKDIEWSDEAISDMALIEKPSARRIRAALERFAQSGSGDIKKLQGFHPPEFRLRAGDFRVRFHLDRQIIRVLRVLNRKDAYR